MVALDLNVSVVRSLVHATIKRSTPRRYTQGHSRRTRCPAWVGRDGTSHSYPLLHVRAIDHVEFEVLAQDSVGKGEGGEDEERVQVRSDK